MHTVRKLRSEMMASFWSSLGSSRALWLSSMICSSISDLCTTTVDSCAVRRRSHSTVSAWMWLDCHGSR